MAGMSRLLVGLIALGGLASCNAVVTSPGGGRDAGTRGGDDGRATAGGAGGLPGGAGGGGAGGGGAGSGGTGGGGGAPGRDSGPGAGGTGGQGDAAAPSDAGGGGGPCAAGGAGFATTPGTAVDRRTCLAWERQDPERDVSGCPLSIRDSNSKLCFDEATKYCAALRLDGQADWRLPAVAELQTIVVPTSAPAVDRAVFPQAVLSIYWTSERKGEKVVGLDFSNAGMVNDHIGPDGPQALRCVRGPVAVAAR
jgi:hypothetical protein